MSDKPVETQTVEFSYDPETRDLELVAMGLILQVFRDIGIEGYSAKRVAEWVMGRRGNQP